MTNDSDRGGYCPCPRRGVEHGHTQCPPMNNDEINKRLAEFVGEDGWETCACWPDGAKGCPFCNGIGRIPKDFTQDWNALMLAWDKRDDLDNLNAVRGAILRGTCAEAARLFAEAIRKNTRTERYDQ